MLVVHGAWTGRDLALWAEDTLPGDEVRPAASTSGVAAPPAPSTSDGHPRPRPDGSPGRRSGPRAHPFAASAPVLAAALGLTPAGPTGLAGGAPIGADGRRPLSVVTAGTLDLWLPGTARAPIPSPESGLASRARTPKISPWRVPALFLTPAQALRLLGSPAAEAGDEGPEWGAGASTRYLAVVAEHALALVRRGRVLPQLVREPGGPAARWRPVITGADASAFRDLAAAMPPVCRAVAGERPAGEVLRQALDALADAATRRSLPERLLRGNRPGPGGDAAERWLFALTAPDAAIPGVSGPEADALSGVLRDWFASAQQMDGPIRLCFRLSEPRPASGDAAEALREPAGAVGGGDLDAGGDDAWELEFALQSVDDPSLYVPAAALWQGERVPGLPRRADEVLLAGLGRAVRLCPELHTALREPRPSGMVVDTAWAFGFLRRSAPLLQAAGYGVRLPAWAGRKALGLKLTTRTRAAAPARAAAGQGFGLGELVEFRVDLAVGDHVISEEELEELARLKVPLVRVRGQWVELDDRQLKAALSVLERRRAGEMTVAEVIQEVVDGGDEELPLIEVDADGLLGDLLSGEAERRLSAVATPETFNGSLRPYQERGLSWLSFLSGLGLGGILADDMGLGKTAQTLSLLLQERAAGDPVAPTLLVCPMSLVSNWHKEAARFAPSLRVYVHHGPTRKREDELAGTLRDADLVITTYGTALRDAAVLAGSTWGRVVCDEAQAIKNSAARQAQAVRSIPAATRLALTGTPVENHLAELWSIMEFCNPGLLGPAKRFRERYQEPIEARGDEDAARALRRATGPFVLRRLKTDKTIISDLPEKLEMKVWCTLTPEQASLYQAVVTDMLAKIDDSEGIERRGNVLATMTRLKQVCNHPAHLLKDGSRLAGRSGKLARLEELAQEVVEEGDKALVFTQYAEFGTLLQPYLAAHLDRPVLWLHGGLPKKKRDELVERFQNDEEPMVFLLSLKAAGTGLNLTAANHVIHVDRWWNPAVEDQATDRAFRIGQTRNVQVRKFICVGTLEERIDEMIERKKALAESVVGAGEDWITDLSTEQLRELFRLAPEAVS
ncbi:helicase HelZ [Sphaerisporangium melleum]|uniref:Helicase HelZ n=1 Tax=Sphaerisporangium melleum TaxID=321316 RepID=A0A917RI65_9ACTN|nr:DEAD/DEAH box helicase [Sphaerisporangium melleum]GGL09606.1 helicase HelZ [Sphaerisporangium melleum]GII67585.1 helicase HelZ [Sphaerisporangium melleum]